ncbi:ubiquinol-cytochrome c reductase iron-sulfur subunit [Haloplanus salinus]|jgi:Rieske Fe-S protein|uniref:Ubiquinol-cytochrome c reductase iron-sulfur subunit n=1 Tax=Haloplanus salinus TaxID=1126245 RepID=A0A368NAI2_9EURY|nr:ubiquinol-cytochrome c reductase iron-sulfur subunit [Haloplanus salinus]RCU47562.1 ubiquinol-cytochrome c reductase iron-sulfur subunit [Haloplanus salinus]
MSADDKYPEESGRRRFVKGVVGGSALAGVGALGTVTVNSATASPGAGGGSTQAWAIENTDGPAPRGMPQIPIEIDSEGYIKGVWPDVETVTQGGRQVQVAEMDLGGSTYSSEWFQYCGVEGYAGIQPSYESDNYFRTGSNPAYDWQSNSKEEGDRFHVDDFSDYEEWGNGIGTAGTGKPASGRWRSEDADDVVPIQLLRSTRIEEAAQDNEWLQASTDQGFIAWLNKCTHFCCVPGYKQSADAARFGNADGVYCQCHQSIYDPFSLVQTLFVARPRPD